MMTTLSAEREAIRQTAEATAAALDGFTVDTNPELAGHAGVYLDGPDGERLFLRLDWRNHDRLTASGVFPPTDARVERPEVGISVKRGGEVIAREITRRLLPGYRESLAEVKEANVRRDAARTARNAAAARIREITGGTSRDDSAHSTINLPVRNDNGYGEVRLNHNGTGASEITLRSVPFAVVERLMQVLAAEQ